MNARLAFVALCLLGTGCVHRELKSFADHPTAPLTATVVHVHKNYLFSTKDEFVIYSCLEQGDALSCKRLCGGNQDIECPQVIETGNGAATNVR
jgi:hypothetical protein